MRRENLEGVERNILKIEKKPHLRNGIKFSHAGLAKRKTGPKVKLESLTEKRLEI